LNTASSLVLQMWFCIEYSLVIGFTNVVLYWIQPRHWFYKCGYVLNTALSLVLQMWFCIEYRLVIGFTNVVLYW